MTESMVRISPVARKVNDIRMWVQLSPSLAFWLVLASSLTWILGPWSVETASRPIRSLKCRSVCCFHQSDPGQFAGDATPGPRTQPETGSYLFSPGFFTVITAPLGWRIHASPWMPSDKLNEEPGPAVCPKATEENPRANTRPEREKTPTSRARLTEAPMRRIPV